MTIEAFDYIWKQGIIKAAESIRDEIDEDVRTKYNFTLDSSQDMFNLLYEAYDYARNQVRTKYFNVGENSENLIDGHKICACITAALLKNHLFKYDMNDNSIPKEIVYSNYALSFLASIYVLYLFLLSDYQKNDDERHFEELRKQATFYFPETNLGHDSYVQGRIKTLALNDISGNDFDILAYADMLFWIEKYNKHILSCKVESKDNQAIESLSSI